MFVSKLLFFGLLVAPALCKLPSAIIPCSRSNPNIDQCILNEVSRLRPNLATGDFGDGFRILPLEPLHLDNIHMDRGADLQAVFTDLTVSGPSDFVVERLKSDVDNLYFDFDILLPRLDYVGKYQLKMKFLLLDINGQGDMEGRFTNARANVKGRGSVVNNNVNFDTLTLKISIGQSTLHLYNLFNGDPTLGDIGNQFINENSQLFLAEIIPGLETSLSKTFLGIAQKIFAGTTFDEVFPL